MIHAPTLLRDLDRISHDPVVCKALLDRLQSTLGDNSLRFMEVCGTHTVSIFQSGLRSLLPPSVHHLSGPGCPVCVTHESEIALLLDVSTSPEVILATFGDLLRVPGPQGKTLKQLRGSGANIQIIYSPLEALALAAKFPEKQIIFPGIGFETTAPAIAGTILAAASQNLKNFSVLSFHKLVMPALERLLEESNSIDGFLMPGHVAIITGLEPFLPLAEKYGKPAVVAGFEPTDILQALCSLAKMRMADNPAIVNDYNRAVPQGGNPTARKIMDSVFVIKDAYWRGLEQINVSGLGIRPKYAQYDAMAKFGLTLPKISKIPGCQCGAVLKGKLQPNRCPLFAKKCTPASPVGPCMVSTEGSCAAWYKYGEH